MTDLQSSVQLYEWGLGGREGAQGRLRKILGRYFILISIFISILDITYKESDVNEVRYDV